MSTGAHKHPTSSALEVVTNNTALDPAPEQNICMQNSPNQRGLTERMGAVEGVGRERRWGSSRDGLQQVFPGTARQVMECFQLRQINAIICGPPDVWGAACRAWHTRMSSSKGARQAGACCCRGGAAPATANLSAVGAVARQPAASAGSSSAGRGRQNIRQPARVRSTTVWQPCMAPT
jgi:hypothetical protein